MYRNSLGLGAEWWDVLWTEEGAVDEGDVAEALMEKESKGELSKNTYVAPAPAKPAPAKPAGGGYVAPTPAAPPPPPVESSGLSGMQMAAIGLGLAAVGAVVWKFKKRGGFSRNSHNEECDLCTATFEDLGRLARVSARRATLSRTASACLTGGTVRHPLGTTVRRGQTAASTSRSLCRTRLARTPLRGAEDLLPNLEPSRQTPCRSREGPPSRVSHRTSGRRA